MSRRLLIITGLSGSGKSTAARVLEDQGFFVVDNLPFVMLPSFIQRTQENLPESTDIAVAPTSVSYYRGHREHLAFARIGAGLDRAEH